MTDATPTVEALDAIITTDPTHADVPYWFATSKGWMTNIPSLFGTAHVLASKTPPTLPKLDENFDFGDERVPVFIYQQALDFFRKVYKAYATEATTYICRDDDGQYSLFIPQQYVTGSTVNHKTEPDDFKDRHPVGTIHSHCMMTAFHSSTDTHDMGKMPGLHMTIGMVMNDQPELAIAMAIGETAFDFSDYDLWDPHEAEDANGFATAPDHWLRFVHPNATAPWAGGHLTTFEGKRRAGFQFGKNFNHQTYRYEHGQNVFGYDEYAGYDTATADTGYFSMPMTETRLHEECVDLAEQGYRLEYTITRDPKGAKEWLTKQPRNTTLTLFADD